MRKVRALVIFALAALLSSETASAQRPHRPHRTAAAAQQAPRPAIWLLEDADTKIYLFGTVHILPRGFRWRSSRFDAIARSADELVMEIAGLDAEETRTTVFTEMQLGKTAPILWRVSPDRRQALQDMVDDLGVPIERLDTLQTWAVAMVLVGVEIVRGMTASEDRAGRRGDGRPRPMSAGEPDSNAGEDAGEPAAPPIAGVEGPLEAEFRASHRPVSGVETPTQQLRFFRELSFAEQREFLDAIVDAHGSEGFGNLGGDGDNIQNAWVRGNVPAMAVMTEGMLGPLYDVLLRRRNAAWTDWLIHRMDRPGTILFAVGAAHLAGSDSVRAMLGARGFRLSRIQ